MFLRFSGVKAVHDQPSGMTSEMIGRRVWHLLPTNVIAEH